MIYNTKRKQIFCKIFPQDIIDLIFEYDITYKEIMNAVLKKNINVPRPDLFHFNNWNGPEILSAYVRNGTTIICNLTENIQELYGKKRNWNRRAQIVEFYQDFIGHQLELVFFDNFYVSMYITKFLHINHLGLMPHTLQHCLVTGNNCNAVNSFFFKGHFTDKTYSIILRDIHSE